MSMHVPRVALSQFSAPFRGNNRKLGHGMVTIHANTARFSANAEDMQYLNSA